jgi:uncharacterized repeat protein (TIGR03803 family)
VFELSESSGVWTLTPVYNDFGQGGGSNPYGGVIFGLGGSLYGTTLGGGLNGSGTVFSLSP